MHLSIQHHAHLLGAIACVCLSQLMMGLVKFAVNMCHQVCIPTCEVLVFIIPGAQNKEYILCFVEVKIK